MPVYRFKNQVEAVDGKLYFIMDDTMVVCMEELLTTSICFSAAMMDSSYIGSSGNIIKDLYSGPESYEVTLMAAKAYILPLSEMPVNKKVKDMSIRELFEAIKEKIGERNNGDNKRI